MQDIISDCSVVASLCAATARTEQGHKNIFSSCWNPYDHALDAPMVSDNGKYVFRFHFNGCYRKVVIDDRLPTSKTTRALHVIDRNDSTVFWPALVEKAYLKVRGGYNFPGSNSGTDLWVLTGWIPEQLFLQSSDIDQDALWRRIFKAFKYGDVLITMGTGKLTQKEERGMGLVGEHDYAVIDMQVRDGKQVLLVKNPWSTGQTWKGDIQFDSDLHDPMSKTEGLDLDEGHSTDGNVPRLSPGTFWMPLNDVFQSFESIYLNWNPGLFAYREDVHLKWDLSKGAPPNGYLGLNPQYIVRTVGKGHLWILLNRHFMKIEQTDSMTEKSRANGNDEGFISIYAFLNGGEKALLSDGAAGRSPYVDSPNALLKHEIGLDQALTLAISEQELSRRTYAFSISVFSLTRTSITPAQDPYTHSTETTGAWTASSSGGNTGSPVYGTNPQFSIRITRTSDILLFLHSLDEYWPVHVKLLWTKGQQVQSVKSRDVVGDSGEHRKGFACAEIKSVPPGAYTAVCSTFEEGQEGKFNLRVSSTEACQVSRVTATTAGRFVTDAATAVLPPDEDCWRMRLSSQRLNRLCVNATSRGDERVPAQQSCSPLKISVELGNGPNKQTLAVSGGDDFVDARHVGISTPEIDIVPSMTARGVWIVLERLGCSGIPSNERIDVQILSDAPCELSTWLKGDYR